MPLQDTTAGVGNDNPTVSFNLAGASDYGTQMPFLDIAKSMRPWLGHAEGNWGAMTNDALKDGGYLDENGWPTDIPNGMNAIGTVWAWGDAAAAQESRAGTYVATYSGEGDIRISGDVTILSQGEGRIVFQTQAQGNITLNIYETDPDDTGNYIRDISIVREDHLALHEAGAIFNPEWLDLISDSRELRFMNWMDTNNSTETSWSERSTFDSATWSGRVPVEVMVRLANEAGVDPWFTMPHLADDEYVREFAEYVRDNLDPALTARVEYSNETWNWAFEQTRWMRDQAATEWGDTSSTAHLDYQIKRATEVGLIWEGVFSQTSDSPALVNVLGVQPQNEWAADRMLSGSGWQANDPDGFVDPSLVFDELAGTTYFGTSIVADESTRLQLINAIQNPNVDAAAWLTQRLLDPAQRTSIPDTLNELIQLKAIADKYDLDLVAYEGGQHVHHSFAVSGLTTAQTTALTEFMTEYVRSADMAMLYEQLWDVWAQVSDGAFMQFTDVASASQYGSWGLLNSLDDTNSRSEFILDQMANATPWWEAQANSAYLQGVTQVGTDGSDVMVGTDQEDYFAGGGGRDEFSVGAGNDGINGGGGVDTLFLHGGASEYSIKTSGNGHLISGPKGDKFVINVENFVFESGESLTLSEMVATLDETLPDPVNARPNAVNDAATTDENNSVTINVLSNDRDADGDTIRVTSVGTTSNGTIVDNGDGTLTYTPNADYSGTDSFTYRIADGNGGTDSASVSITVNDTISDPTPDPEPTPLPTSEADLSKNILYVGHSLVYRLDDIMQDMITDSGGSGWAQEQRIGGAPLRWSWDNAANASDGVNSRAILEQGQTDVLILTEAIPLINHVTWNDTSGYAARFYNLAIENNPDTQVFLYETWHDLRSGTGVDVPHDSGDDVAWRARLDQDLSVWEGVVADVNAQRPAGAPEMQLIPVGQAMGAMYDAIEAGQVPGISSIRDLFEDNIHYSDAGAYFISMVQYMAIHGGVPTYDTFDATNQWGREYTPPTQAQINVMTDIAWSTVSDYFGYDGSSGGGSNGGGSGTDPVNVVPDAVDDAATTDEDTSVTINVLSNDSDADGDTIRVTSVGTTSNGTIVDNGDGTLTYTPNADYSGTDSFTYRIADGNGGADTATVSVTVNAAPDTGGGTTPSSGFSAEYFRTGTDISNLDQIDFTQTPDAVATVDSLNYSAGNETFWEGGPADYFAARYTATLTIETAGTYRFYLTSDDGSELRINGQSVIDHDGLHSATERTGEITLAAGTHTIETLYFERTGNQVLRLEWSGADTGGTRSLLEGEALDSPSEKDASLDIDADGQIHDGDGTAVVDVDDTEIDGPGVVLRQVSTYSDLGSALTAQGEEFSQAYVVYERGKTVTLTDTGGTEKSVMASYWSTVQNQSSGQDSTPLTSDAVNTALMFGDVIFDPSAFYTGAGHDRLNGSIQAETFYAEGGNDIIRGRGGDDHIHGGTGNDTMYGNEGADRFYLSAGDGIDTIGDFDVTEDMLILQDYLASGQSFAGAASEDTNGDLVISNGTDEVTFNGLTIDDLDWIQLG